MRKFCGLIQEQDIQTKTSASTSFCEVPMQQMFASSHLDTKRPEDISNSYRYYDPDVYFQRLLVHELKKSSHELHRITQNQMLGHSNGTFEDKSNLWQSFSPRQDRNMGFKSKVSRWLQSLPFRPHMLSQTRSSYPHLVEGFSIPSDEFLELIPRTDNITNSSKSPSYGDWSYTTTYPVSWFPDDAFLNNIDLNIDIMEPFENINLCNVTASFKEMLVLQSEALMHTPDQYPNYPSAYDLYQDELYDLKSRIYTYNVIQESRRRYYREPLLGIKPPLQSDLEFLKRSMTFKDVGQGIQKRQLSTGTNYVVYMCLSAFDLNLIKSRFLNDRSFKDSQRILAQLSINEMNRSQHSKDLCKVNECIDCCDNQDDINHKDSQEYEKEEARIISSQESNEVHPILKTHHFKLPQLRSYHSRRIAPQRLSGQGA